MKDGDDYVVAREDAIYYAQLFPALNIGQEFHSMEAWLEGNPSRQKTQRGIRRFIANWLIKSAREVPSRVRAGATIRPSSIPYCARLSPGIVNYDEEEA